MKSMRWLVCLSVLFVSTQVFSQGSLTPPGAPAPTMKTLDQVEARTPIPAATSTQYISQSGSYYLTGNITVSTSHGISIQADNVTLDLNGFTIESTDPTPSSEAVFLQGVLRNVTIVNGFIKGGVVNTDGTYAGPGFTRGIYAIDDFNVRVSGVSVSGCLYDGIYLSTLDETSLAESCLVRTVGGIGIHASTIKSSVAIECGDAAIYGGQVSDCRGKSTGLGYGVYATTANNCTGISDSGTGLYATTANNCTGTTTSGIYGLSTGIANNCTGTTTSGNYGLSAGTANNCKGTTTSGNYGLYAATADNCKGICNSGSGKGLYATTANNCHGLTSGSGTGLYASSIATGCYGYSYSGIGLHAYIANSCYASTHSGTAQNINYKYNMP